jgi:hypothetical protein
MELIPTIEAGMGDESAGDNGETQPHASPTDYQISPMTQIVTAVAPTGPSLPWGRDTEPHCPYFAICRDSYDQDWDRQLPPEHERWTVDELHYILRATYINAEEYSREMRWKRKHSGEAQQEREKLRQQHLRTRAPIMTLLHDFTWRRELPLKESIQRSNMHYRTPTVENWLLEMASETQVLSEGDELGYQATPPTQRNVTETQRCPKCNEIVSILQHSENVLHMTSQDREAGLQAYLTHHYRAPSKLTQSQYTHWDRNPHMNHNEELCDHTELESTWRDTGPPSTIIIDLGDQMHHWNKPRIPHEVQIGKTTLNRYYHTATMETGNKQLHTFRSEGRGWFTIDGKRIKRLPKEDLEKIIHSAIPNIVVYTRAEPQAWKIAAMAEDKPQNINKGQQKRRIQTTLLAEPQTPLPFPPQANLLNSIIPQLISSNRPLCNYIKNEYVRMSRQPERDMGIIHEGSEAQWHAKRKHYRTMKLPWTQPTPWSRKQRRRAKIARRVQNVIQNWPLYPNWPGELQERRSSLNKSSAPD